MKVILLSGKAEAGKTTAAEAFKKAILDSDPKLKVIITSYGSYLKETAKQLWGWNGEKDEAGRELLQWWGTDVVRKKNMSFWVYTVVRLADVASDYIDYLIIDDNRFPNEIEAWTNYSNFSIRIERPGHISKLTPEQLKHPSETALDCYRFDCVFYAETKDELSDIVKIFVDSVLLSNSG